jgi:hypothetical protein
MQTFIRLLKIHPMSKIVDFQEWLNQNEANKKKESKLFLTEAEVRSFPKFKNANDEQVQNIINTLHDLALISYHVFCKEENGELQKAA